MYVADFTSNAIDVFSRGANGNVAPIRRIVGAATGINSPEGIGVDSDGNIYVANRNANNITVYSSTANGNAAPTRTIGGGLSLIDTPEQLVALPNGAIYVVCRGSDPNAVQYFAPGLAGNVSPTRSLNISLSRNPTLGLAVDTSGQLYVCTTDFIGVYAAGASGDDAPVRTIHGSATEISFLEGLAVDGAGNVYASDNDANEILIFGPGANGDVAPTRKISGPSTNLQYIIKPALD